MSISNKLYLEKESQKLQNHKFTNVLKTIEGEKNMPEFNIYDLKYYEDELDKFERWFEGEIMIGNIKFSRTFVKCQDRYSKTKHCEESFTVITRVTCVSKDPFATMAMIHGFAECAMLSFLETAMHHALNGFEVVLADMKSFGYASGIRGTRYAVQDWHEQIGVLLQNCPTDKPVFIQAHSMGC